MNQLINQKPKDYKAYAQQIQSMYQKPIAQTSSALILTLITITFFGFAAIRPTLATVSQLVGELEEKKDIEAQMDKKLKALASAQDEYLQSQNLFDVFDVAIPDDDDFTTLLLQLEYLVNKNNLDIIALRSNTVSTYNQNQTTGTFNPIEFRFSTIGNYQDQQLLLKDIKQLDRILEINSISFTQPQEDLNNQAVILSLQITAYYTPNLSISNPTQ